MQSRMYMKLKYIGIKERGENCGHRSRSWHEGLTIYLNGTRISFHLVLKKLKKKEKKCVNY